MVQPVDLSSRMYYATQTNQFSFKGRQAREEKKRGRDLHACRSFPYGASSR